MQLSPLALHLICLKNESANDRGVGARLRLDLPSSRSERHDAPSLPLQAACQMERSIRRWDEHQIRRDQKLHADAVRTRLDGNDLRIQRIEAAKQYRNA